VNGLLLTGCEIEGVPGLDVRVRNGVVAEVAANLEADGDDVLAAAGGALLPGLHDHHLHLMAMAAALESIPCGPPAVKDRDVLASALRGASRAAPPGAWLRGVGYHESVAGTLDCDALDALVADRPVRVQHRSGALWVLNRAAIRVTGLEHAAPSGRLRRADRVLGERVPPVALDLVEVGRRLAAVGITGVTDATPRLDGRGLDVLTAAVARDDLPQRLVVLGAAHAPDPGHPRVTLGPWKLVLDEADDEGFDPAAIAAAIAAAHAAGRAVAIHCVSRVEVVVAIDALARSGPVSGDRLEHASVLPIGLEHRLRELGVAVVTQPNFIAERGDAYARDVDADDLELLYRCGTLLSAGVAVAGGTDAPFGTADPWRAMRAAVTRRSDDGRVLGAHEAVTPRAALDLFLSQPHAPGGVPRRVRPGTPADLCLLREPLADALRTLDAGQVKATIIGGRVVHDDSTQSAELSSQRASTA
jgi:predicted amidohydrolase YtcJ